MKISEINQLLGDVKVKLESLESATRVDEGQHMPSEQHPSRLSQAQKRLRGLYGKLTAGRSDATEVKATGSKR